MLKREITTHHDGHGLAESLRIYADELGPGGASHFYIVTHKEEKGELEVAKVFFQKGPRGEHGSAAGIIDNVLLAIVADRMKCFQDGPFPDEHNEATIEFIDRAMTHLKTRADERASRGVLGKNEP